MACLDDLNSDDAVDQILAAEALADIPRQDRLRQRYQAQADNVSEQLRVGIRVEATRHEKQHRGGDDRSKSAGWRSTCERSFKRHYIAMKCLYPTQPDHPNRHESSVLTPERWR